MVHRTLVKTQALTATYKFISCPQHPRIKLAKLGLHYYRSATFGDASLLGCIVLLIRT